MIPFNKEYLRRVSGMVSSSGNSNVMQWAVSSYGCSINHIVKSDLINNSFTICKETADHLTIELRLSEFPGNCSTLVLSSIQQFLYPNRRYDDTIDDLVKCCLSIAYHLRYGAVFASVSNTIARDILVERYGFSVSSIEIRNPHSGNLNYFLSLDMNVVEE